MKKSVKRIIGFTFLSISIIGLLYIIIFNDTKTVVFTHYEININTKYADKITIAHISDTHFPQIKADTAKLAEDILNQQPDIIALTGDIIDNEVKNSGVEKFLDLIDDACPVYYVYGNHEKINAYTDAQMRELVKDLNIRILQDEYEKITVRGHNVIVAGLDAKSEGGGSAYSKLSFSGAGNTGVKILLAHHPEDFEKYSDPKNAFLPDLVLSGHTHGGGIRFPLIGGIIAPNQGLFPKYDSGLYEAESGTKMIISRGIGLSGIPLRVLNKPEVPIIKIKL